MCPNNSLDSEKKWTRGTRGYINLTSKMFKISLAKVKQNKNLGRKETETLISLEFFLRILLMNFDIPDSNF